MKKKIVFITGTRADFGKLKPLMLATEASETHECRIFATGMHMLSRYGLTVEEIHKTGFRNIHAFMNQIHGEPMEMVLANTIHGLSRYVHECKPDLIVVHGDRVEALAGAIVGAIRNILVAHIEGGELSGTIDDLIRHSVTKLSHLHFVANSGAAERLRQLGESPENIFTIGSPDIDVMLSDSLPDLSTAKSYYDINFERYAIMLYHPVTTEPEKQAERAKTVVSALRESDKNYVVIYPNNDEGCEAIFSAYTALEGNPRFRVFPSLRFEYFLTLLKNSSFIIGNSSAGIMEAPVYGIPSINIGNRQQNRFRHTSIIEADFDKEVILSSIDRVATMKNLQPCHYFGRGNSARSFLSAMDDERIWSTPKQKIFNDFPLSSMNLRSVQGAA